MNNLQDKKINSDFLVSIYWESNDIEAAKDISSASHSGKITFTDDDKFELTWKVKDARKILDAADRTIKDITYYTKLKH